MKFRKKPVVIEALQVPPLFHIDERLVLDEWLAKHQGERPCRWSGDGLVITTLEGEMRADVGDWIIRGVQGELYPCKPEIFGATYEPAGGDRAPDQVDIFLAEVRAELLRARAKFPGDRIMTLALAEEFGELCKAVLDETADRVRKEAVQTAVMAARVVLDGDGSVNEWRAAKGLDPLVQTP